MTPVVSVVIAAYNVEKYIEKCVRSVINQDYPNIEIICVNDASTDGTIYKLKKLVEEFPKIKLVSLSKNSGLSEARNAGIRVASGEFISFIDGDDEIKPKTYSRLIPFFTNDVDVVWFGINIIYEAHEEYRESDNNYYSVKKRGKGKIDLSELLEFDCSVCNKIFRRVQLTNEYLFKGRYYEDALFFMRFFAVPRTIYFCNEKFYNYYRHAVSIMSKTMDGTPGIAINHLYILDDLYNFWEKNNLLPERKSDFCKIFTAYFWFSYRHCVPFERAQVIHEAILRLRQWDLSRVCDPHLKALHDGAYSIIVDPKEEDSQNKRPMKKLKGFENLICIRNEYGKKVFRILSFKIASFKKKR